MTERLPAPDASRFPPLAPRHLHTLTTGRLLGRIYPSAGAHKLRWDEFRSYGPTGARFDHQPPPPRLHPRRGVYYGVAAAKGVDPPPVLRTCVAEVFTDRGAIELGRNVPYFVLWRPARRLRLLDLADSDWLTLAGGNAAISSGLRSTARDWARAIYRHYTAEHAVDGLYYPCSTIPPARSIVLFERARTALPPRPELQLPLTHPALRAELEHYARELRLELLA